MTKMQTHDLNTFIVLAMNVLVNYASDSDSESEQNSPPIPNGQAITQQQQQVNENVNEADDSFVSAALKDLQSFAARAEDTSIKGDLIPLVRKGSIDDSEDLELLSFMKEIDAIPCPLDEQEREQRQQPQPQPPPPPSPPILMSTASAEHPPPPPPPSPSILNPTTLLPSSHDNEDLKKVTSLEIQVVQSRLYHLSLLPSSSIDQKDLERRLLEFAIRIVDWEKGGLYESYFLGQERAEAIINNEQLVGETTSTELPPFGGVVGSMIRQMYELEQMTAPPGWAAVWDAEDEAYGFQHIRTGTYSPVFPSQELIYYLDPPSFQPSGSPVLPKNSRSYFMTRSTKHATGGYSPSPATISSAVSDSASQTNTPPLSSSSKSSLVRPKKRKVDTSITDPGTEDSNFMDSHIHPSRRAALNKSGASVLPSLSASAAGSSSKTMPKKLASLLQKWSEKDLEMSDEDDIDNEKEQQENIESDPHQTYATMTGSNTQSLGGDWRDRRLHPR